jgi:hypothetical protein
VAQDGYPPLLKKSRWCVLKRKQNLTPQQKFRLRDLLRYNLQTVRAYLLFRTFRILELALHHSLGKLPEPELTHEFF